MSRQLLGRRLGAALAVCGMWLFAAGPRPAHAATAYFGFTGSFTDGSETQSFLFNTGRAFPPRTVPFWLRTWHAEGGTNAADGWIDPGGFNPFLRLFNDDPAHIATNNDYPPGLDSRIDWHTPGIPEALPRDGYRLDLASESGTLGDGDGHWAVDLVGPADAMTLTGASDDGPAASTITSLWMGTDNADRTPAELSVGMFEHLTVAGGLFVAWTGNATVNVSTGSLATYWGAVGNTPGSEGSVTLSQGGNWTTAENSSNSWIGGNGTGNLRIESGGLARFGRSLLLGLSAGGEGNVTVTGHDSYLIVNHDLFVGEFGVGYLRVEDRGQVNSSGVGPPFEGDFIGHLIGSHGTVEVDGQDSLWQTDLLTVGNNGQGTIAITGGGKIDTLGNAYIGRWADHLDSNVTLTGAAPDGSPSTWEVSGDLHIAGSDTGPPVANSSRLTINPGAEIDVTGSTTIHGDGRLELHGGALRTGALIKAGSTFEWTSGTLELTNSRLTLDCVTPDSMFGNSLTLGAGQSLRLNRTLDVGYRGTGTLNVTGGGHVTNIDPDGWEALVGYSPGADGRVLVDGNGSHWDIPYLLLGAYGRGELTISGGASVSSQQSSMGIHPGSSATATITGENSTWDLSGELRVGGAVTIGGGAGTLRIENGGAVAVGGMLKVWPTGSFYLLWGGGSAPMLSADHIALEPGANYACVGAAVVRANRLTGFGNLISLPNFYLGHQGGVSGAGAHAVGVGQTLDVSGVFIVGYDAPATLDVSGGGEVASTGGHIAFLPGSGGSRVSVSGGSSWRIPANSPLTVGGIGLNDVAGALVVSSEGVVTADNVEVCPAGTITLDGGAIASSGFGNPDNQFWLRGGVLEGRGTVEVVSRLLNEGVVSPGLSAGLLNIVGDYVQEEAGTLAIELGGTDFSRFDRLRIVDGSATLGGKLQVSLLPGFMPAANNSFEFLTATGGVLPGFTDFALPHLDDGLTWGVSYSPTSVVLSVIGPSFFEADFDEDGGVDGDDLARWQAGFGLGASAIHTQGDADGDRDVDGADFLVWQRQLGMTNSGATAVTTPEPAAKVMLLSGLLAILSCRRAIAS